MIEAAWRVARFAKIRPSGSLPPNARVDQAHGDADTAIHSIGKDRTCALGQARARPVRTVARHHQLRRLYIVVGNAERLRGEMLPRVTRIDSEACPLGRYLLWQWGGVP